MSFKFLMMGSSPKRVEYIIKDVNLSPCPLGSLEIFIVSLEIQCHIFIILYSMFLVCTVSLVLHFHLRLQFLILVFLMMGR